MKHNFQFVWGYSVWNCLGALLIRCSIGKERLPLIEHPLLTHIGRISYGIYIFHYPVAVLRIEFFDAAAWSVTGLFLFLVSLAVTIMLAWVSYFYFERKFLELKAKLA